MKNVFGIKCLFVHFPNVGSGLDPRMRDMGKFILSTGPKAPIAFLGKFISGEIPKGLKVLHRCDNPGCIRPYHLFLGTQKDNVDDMCKKGRHHKLKGSTHGRSKLNEDQVRNIREEIKYLSQRKLASKYGVGKTTIAHICNKTSWNHID